VSGETSAGPLRRRASRPLLLALLGAAIVAAFAGVVQNDWVQFDDPRYVYENPHVIRGLTLDGVRWFLHEPHSGNWHPLTSILHMLDVQLFGLNPAGHHAMSLVFHVLNALLLVGVLFRLTGAWWRSVMVSAFFSIHPLRVESVAWISERKDVASALFFLLAIEAYRRWVERPGAGRYALLIAAFALGLMSKPMLVTLPFVLVLLDVWPLGRLSGDSRAPGRPSGGRARIRPLAGLLAEKWPMIALAVAASVVTFIVQRNSGAVASTGYMSIERRICNALISYWRYVGKSIWPVDLSVFYPNARTADFGGAIASALGLALVTWAALRWRKSRPYLAVGWFWYLGMALPVIGLIQVGGQAYADRYTYLPTIGLLIAAVWGVGDLVARSRAGRIAAASASIVVLAALAATTARQVAVWKDTRTLFAHALAVTPLNPIAHQYLGDDLVREGRLELAVPHYESALRIAPDFAEVHNTLGGVLGALGRYDEAIEQLREAIRLAPTAQAHHNLGFAYAHESRMDDAIREYREALRLDPDFYSSVLNLGAAIGARGELAESERLLRHAVALMTGDAEAHRALAVTLTRSGRVEHAIVEYGEILNSNPDDLDALNNVAWIRATHAEAMHRDAAVAVRMAERARDRSPEPVAVIFSTLAAAYAEAGRFPEAVTTCERAIRIAKADGRAEEAARFGQQLARYRAGRPFHFEH
jgi:tetratricopeptide (TPR) repeat protein